MALSLRTVLVGALVGISLSLSAPAQVLIKEIVSREVSIQVGLLQPADLKESASREVSIAVQNGPAAPYSQVASREYGFTIGSPESPPQVTGFLVTASPTGHEVRLDWSNYNQWLVGDIARFDIYLSDQPFSSVTARTPFLSVSAETFLATLTGLPTGRDHFVAIVAVDALGNANPAVVYSAAYILSAQVVSREVSIFVGDRPELANSQAISREVAVTVASADPPPTVLGTVITPSPTGDAVTLDWSAYNQWAARDVARFDIYLSDQPFTSIDGRTALRSVPAEAFTTTLTGLPTFRDHFFAVVAVDALGNANPNVVYSAAYILSPQVVSREVSLFVAHEGVPSYAQVISREASLAVYDDLVPAPVTGLASGFFARTSTARYRAIDLDWTAYNEAAQRDVSRYRIYLDTAFFTNVTGRTPFTFSTDGTQQLTLTGLDGDQIYYVAVVAEDAGGRFDPAVRALSAQASANENWMPTTQSLRFENQPLVNGSTIRASGTLQVDPASAPGVVRVDFSYRLGAGGEIALGSDTTPANGFSAFWNATGLADGSIAFIVRGYDSAGRLTEVVRTVAFLRNLPPEIAGFTFGGSALADGATITTAGRVAVQASDGDGINFAEFFLQPAAGGARSSLGIDFTPGNGLDVLLDAGSIADGVYDLSVQVNDALGTRAEVTRRITLALAPPAAPLLTAPAGGSVTVVAVEVRGTAPVGATLRIFRNGVAVFTGLPAANGSFAVQVPLLDGANVFYAESSNRAGPGPASASITVTKVASPPELTLRLAQASVIEGGTLAGTITIDKTLPQPLNVSLGVSQGNRLSFPASVSIPAGQTAATFTAQSVQNANIEPAAAVTLIATAPGSTAAIFRLEILDDDTPAITLALQPARVREDGGAAALRGTLMLDRAAGVAFTASFAASPAGQVVLPEGLVVPANTTSVSVPITLLDNPDVDGERSVAITARLLPASGGDPLATAPPATLAILDDEGPTLGLAFERTLLLEGASTSGTVTRSVVTNRPLTVTLASAQTGKLVVEPASVTIPANKASAPFTIRGVADPAVTGNEIVTITARALAFPDSSAALTITDRQEPDLVLELVAPPTGAETESWIDVRYRLRNQGATAAVGPFTQRILLSNDPAPGGDTVLAVADFTGTLPAGAALEQSLRVRLPRESGSYWLVVEGDANRAVAEALEDNNVTVATTPMEIAPAYSTTLAVAPATVPSGTPIPIAGSATLRSGGPAAHALVNIHITGSGITRVISALTGANGQFTAAFTPLPGEGGLFRFGAAHPGLATAPVQDEVRVYGLRAEPAAPVLKLLAGTPQAGRITLTNLADLPLSGLAVNVTGLPSGVQFTPSLAGTSVSASGTVALDYAISASAPQETQSFTLSVRSTEGAELAIPFTVSVVANQPLLVAEPGELVGGMLRGRQQLLTFSLRNGGQVASGPVNLLLPGNASWMRLSTALPIPALAPGEAVPITIQLLPPADLPLEEYSGNLVATDGSSRVSIPFKLRALSELSGTLTVRAEDEYTYYATGNPPLAGATVTVTDALTRVLVATKVTDANGRADFGALREGYYQIEVTADRHTTFRVTELVAAGRDNVVDAFLSRQTVTYHWTVEPTQIEDRYKVTVDTTFETNVPLPVVTMTPAVIDLAEILTEETIVNVTVTNHGLLAGNRLKLNYPTHPKWEFTPLVTDLGTLPAKSSITVPVKIRRLPAAPALARPATAVARRGGSGTCTTGAGACVEIPCGEYTIRICGSQAITNADDDCGEFAPQPGECRDCGGGLVGAGSTTSSSSGTVKLVCDPECLLNAAIDCIPLPPIIACPRSFQPCWDIIAGASTDQLDGLDCATAPSCFLPLPGGPFCIYGIVRCFIKIPRSAAAFGSATDPVRRGEPGSASVFNADAIAPYRAGLRAHLDAFNELTGARDGVWINDQSGPVLGTWFDAFRLAASSSSPEGPTLSAGERQQLLGGDLPEGVPAAEVGRFLDRWNRTVSNWNAGVRRHADAPPGADLDFIDLAVLKGEAQKIQTATEYSISKGFPDPITGLIGTYKQLLEAGAGGGVCGRVKLRLEQEAVLTRDAFRATLELENNGASALSDLQVTVSIRDSAGVPADERFAVRFENASSLTAIDGSGTLAGASRGSARWQIIPTVDAAPAEPVRYLVGGRLSYKVDGVEVSVPLGDAPITVMPSPRLTLRYFHQRDVFSDDPFTDPVEPALPYSLAVMVENRGAGVAKNFRLTSAQPKIIENEKGLLADFKIIATQVAGQPLQPSLTARFGDIAAGEIKIAEWLMTSSIHGLFIDYEATFEHLDGGGNPKLSLIDGVEIHEMTHQVKALGALDDGKPDFLVNDVPDARDLPETLHLSDGTTAPVTVVEQAQVSGSPSAGQTAIELTAIMPAGWTYLRVAEPSNGQMILARVVREDGVELPLDINVWTTDRTFLGAGRRPAYENILHLFDRGGPGRYTLTYRAKQLGDTQAPSSFVRPLPAQSPVEFAVAWQGSDDRAIGWFDIFVSIDGAPFTLWRERTTETAALYRGESGRTYAFYSRATDAAGNRQLVSGAADASTIASVQNMPPTLAAVADQQVIEGTTLSLQLLADDPDGRRDLLRFSFDSEVPPALTLNAETGELRWVTGENDGGRELAVTVRATDRGVPAASVSRTFLIRVVEKNEPPRLVLPTAPKAVVGQPYALQLSAEDVDLPAQSLSFSLGSVRPSGMSIDAATGRIAWTPRASFAEQTVPVSVAVTDNGNPAGAHLLTLLVTVDAMPATGPIEIKQPAIGAPPVVASDIRFTAAAAGDYAGLLIAAPDDGETRGFVEAKVARTGAFSGRVRLGTGASRALRGQITPDGLLSASLTQRSGPTYTASMRLQQTAAGGRKLVGTITVGTAVLAGDLQRAEIWTKRNPSPVAGSYTMLVPADSEAGNSVPHGDGYAVVTVATTGKVRARGVFGEGTTFSQGGAISVDGEWPFFATAPSPASFAAGSIRFREVPGVSDFDGDLLWRRLENSRAAEFKPGFTVSRGAVGSRYQPPRAGQRAILALTASLDNATLFLVGPQAPASFGPWVLTWDAANKLSYSGTDSLSGAIAPATGLVTGRVSRNAPPFSASFGGVVLQKQGVVGGTFRNPRVSGGISIQPGSSR